MDGTRIEARRRKRQIQRKKQARLRKVLVIMLVIMAAVTAAIGTWSYFRTNVYQDDEEFQAYAEEQIKDNRIFKVGNVEKISCEYGSPISYAVDYQVIDNESVKEFRDEKVKEAKKKFRKEKTREEKAREAAARQRYWTASKNTVLWRHSSMLAAEFPAIRKR